MLSIHRSALLLLTGVLALGASATTWYISASGNDSNNGTSQSTPWRTIDRANQSTYSVMPGDQILFQRGGVYRGELIWGVSGTASQPVTIGAYGTGPNPVISGSKLITNWTVHSGNIYKAYVGMKVDQVYIGGVRMTLARTPNAGSWYRNSQGSNNTLTSTNLTQGSGYFTGARCVLRSNASSIDTLKITAHNGTTLTFSNNPTNVNMNTDNWGFFIERKLTLLDIAGEWFYDVTNGYLYLWAPNNANPNSLTVEAGVHRAGINCYWQRHYGVIQNLTFQHQIYAGVLNDGADHVTVTGCTMQDIYHGIRSYGSYDNYNNNTIQRSYASGCLMIDNNSTFENNVLTDIALIAGAGESNWGYFGIRGIGPGNIIRGNRFTNIGYTAIEIDNNHLAEKNVIDNYTMVLNDGGGINFDNSNGIVIQDNVITDAIGGLDGSSTILPHYQNLGVGIYVGNTSNTNSTIQRNTIANVPGVGINADHTMNTANLDVKNNTIFNCKIGMSISDYSNYNGPFAVWPYFVPAYNDEYTGNTIYCVTKDQLCVRFFNCYNPAYVDFGTFSNNKYHNPYNELSFFYHNLNSNVQRYYTMERWAAEHLEESGSTRSSLRQAPFSTASELTGNLVPSGSFTTNVTGWGGWPTNAQVTRVTNYLDNGALRAFLPDASVYPSFGMRNPEWFAVENTAWYRVRLSIQSTLNGDLDFGLKGENQATNPYMIDHRQIPFSTERRDLEIYFQSNSTEQAQLMFVNQWTEPLYYLDNVDVRKVTVSVIDPLSQHTILVNGQSTAQNLALPAGCWSDLAGAISTGSISVPAYSSKVFYKVADTQCSGGSNGTVSGKVFLAGALDWSTNLMRDDLRALSYIPAIEPYSGIGWALENNGATVSPAVLATTGNNAPVDWVIAELRNNAQGYAVAARRACLVRRDGTLIAPDGSTTIGFTTSATVGKHLVVYHRNHLAVITGNPIATNGQMIDFTVPTTATYGTNPQQTNGSRFALWSGNTSMDHLVKYTGGSNDRDGILVAIGGTVPTATVLGYRVEDVNMDGVIKYTGANNDRDPILTVVGGTLPTNVVTQQLP